MIEANLYSGLTLAYMGDSVYETKIRKALLESGLVKINNLHKTAINYTKGVFQAKLVRYLIEYGLITEDEISIYKRGRNSSIKHTRKNVKLSDYLDATGLESLIGYLFLTNNETRIDEIVKVAFSII